MSEQGAYVSFQVDGIYVVSSPRLYLQAEITGCFECASLDNQIVIAVFASSCSQAGQEGCSAKAKCHGNPATLLPASALARAMQTSLPPWLLLPAVSVK